MEFVLGLGGIGGVSNDVKYSPLNEFIAYAKIGGGSESYFRCCYCHSPHDGGPCPVCHYITS